MQFALPSADMVQSVPATAHTPLALTYHKRKGVFSMSNDSNRPIRNDRLIRICPPCPPCRCDCDDRDRRDRDDRDRRDRDDRRRY